MDLLKSFYSIYHLPNKWNHEVSMGIHAVFLALVAVFLLSGNVHAQCTLSPPSSGVLTTYTEISSNSQAEPSGDFVICEGIDYTFGNNAIHDVWMEANSSLLYEGNGMGHIFAVNNSYVYVEGNGIMNIYVTAGSTCVITNGAHNVYLECGAELIVQDGAPGVTVYYECADDISYVVPPVSSYEEVHCTDVELDFPSAPAPVLDFGGCFDLSASDFPYVLDASSVPGPYSWSTGESTASITVNSYGSYSVSVPSICASGIATFDLNEPYSSSLEVNTVDSWCGNTYPLDITVSDGPGPFLWSTGETSQVITVTSPGTYSVSVPSGCSTVSASIDLPASFPDAQVVDLGQDLSVCASDFPIILDAGDADTYTWSTGETSQTISVNSFGSFSVEVTGPCGQSTDEVIITASAVPSPDLGPDITICPSQFPITLDAGTGDTYSWSTGESSQTIEVNSPGTYDVTVSSSCGSGSDEIEVRIHEAPELDLGPDIMVCENEVPVAVYDLATGGMLQWWNGQNTDTVYLNSSEIVWAERSYICGNVRDSVSVTVLEEEIETIEEEICQGDTALIAGLSLSESGFYSATVENGGSNGCDMTMMIDLTVNPSVYDTIITYLDLDERFYIAGSVITDAGTYDLIETGFSACPRYIHLKVMKPVDEQVMVFVPSAFTPDGDGVNEVFKPVLSTERGVQFADFKFIVSDRDGHVVYESTDMETCQWNGENPFTTDFYSQDATYNWLLTYRLADSSDKVRRRGMVVLLR